MFQKELGLVEFVSGADFFGLNVSLVSRMQIRFGALPGALEFLQTKKTFCDDSEGLAIIHLLLLNAELSFVFQSIGVNIFQFFWCGFVV